jgi:uncharacterized YigZ family protein
VILLDSYTTVQHHAEFEYEDRKSVFIGEAMPVSSEAEALNFINTVKKKYPDARHHVYAYVLRENSTTRFSDDREPQGTAGMPVLDVIRKSMCTDTVIVVTRYFGGTLLGTGGLVRAYTSAAAGALREANIITYDIYTLMKITLTYSDYQKVMPFFQQSEFRVDDTKYADSVSVTGKIKSSDFDKFEVQMTELTSARATVEVIEEKFDY